jgi:glycerophosphoryl diester phosphodiesterase
MGQTPKQKTPMIRSIAFAALMAVTASSALALEIQGHRGARGLAPENTLPAFATALSLGVDNIEIDLQLTKDGHLVIGHDPVLKSYTTRGPDGKWISDPGPAVYHLTLEELRRYDVGRLNPNSKYGQTYPDQKPVDGTRMPSWDEFIALVNKSGNDKLRFNIELKLDPGLASVSATAEQYAEAAVKAIRAAGIEKRSTVISFNWATTAAVARLAPEIDLGLITFEANSPAANMARGQPGPSPWLNGFDVDDYASVPQLVKAAGGKVWVPFWRNVTPELVKEAHDLGLKVNVWTVNDTATMEKMIDIGVDGITTDYPNRLRKVMEARGLPLPPATPAPP